MRLINRRQTFTTVFMRNVVKLALNSVLILSMCIVYGCVAYNFSSDFLPLEENQARKAMFQSLALGVERPPDKPESYDLGKFLENLKKSEVFRTVAYVDGVSTTDLVLTSFFFRGTNPYHACMLGFEGQLLTIATAGLFPQVCKAGYEVSFALYSPKHKQQRKAVSFRYQTRNILGWAALFYLPSSDWTVMPRENEYADLLKAVFYRQADDIYQLLK